MGAGNVNVLWQKAGKYAETNRRPFLLSSAPIRRHHIQTRNNAFHILSLAAGGGGSAPATYSMRPPLLAGADHAAAGAA